MHAEYRSKLVSANAAHESAFDEYRADGKQTLTLRWLWKVVEQLAPYGAYSARHEKIGYR